MSLPVCKLSREKSSKVRRKRADKKLTAKGYSSCDKQYYIGYKLHLITCSRGVYHHYELRPANQHDIRFLKELDHTHLVSARLIGDTAYRSQPVQLELFDWQEFNLKCPIVTISMTSKHTQKNFELKENE